MDLSDVFKHHPLPDMRAFYPQAVINLAKSRVPHPSPKAVFNLPALNSKTCPECKANLGAADNLFKEWSVCDYCGHHFLMGARERVASLADPGSFHSIGRSIQAVDFLGFTDDQPYSLKLAEAKRKTGLTDAVITGRCKIGGIRSVLVALDFNFLGGSMGSVLGEQVTSAFEFALKHHLPVVTVSNSGGARMQEGILSLMQMAKTAAAVERFHAAGLFYLSVLANPTTGGVFASFASLGDLIVAEPRALIGFAGPRVVEQTTGKKLPPGSHTAEFQLERGLIDAVVARPGHSEFIRETLKHVCANSLPNPKTTPSVPIPVAPV